MKTKRTIPSGKRWSTLACVIALASVAGCTDRNNNGVPESAPTAGEVEQATDTVANAASEAADSAASLGTNATITAKINAAYAANPSISALKIDVDTTENNKTVTLNGTVTNTAQKNLAANIAKQQAPGYKIVNNLKTSGGASPTMNGKGN